MPGWCPPVHGWVKLNSDDSFVSEGEAGARRTLYSYRDALEAELCACMEGLSVAIQRSDLPINIEMDSFIGVCMIQRKEVDSMHPIVMVLWK